MVDNPSSSSIFPSRNDDNEDDDDKNEKTEKRSTDSSIGLEGRVFSPSSKRKDETY
jgi:hypothetical protein